MWLLVFSTLSPTTRPTFQLRLKVALLVECGLHLVTLLFTTANMYLNRLWRRPQGRQRAMTFLAWNCRGSSGSLHSSKVMHLACLITSTKAKVCFISETRNSTIKCSTIINWFNFSDAFVVPTEGQSGGLWFFWNNEVTIAIVDHSRHYIFATCTSSFSFSNLLSYASMVILITI